MANTPNTSKNPKAPVAKDAKIPWYKKPGIFLQGILKELKKVSWPNKKELINHTWVCLVIVALFVVVIFCFDTVFSFITNFLYSL